jgi:hypothetical protein
LAIVGQEICPEFVFISAVQICGATSKSRSKLIAKQNFFNLTNFKSSFVFESAKETFKLSAWMPASFVPVLEPCPAALEVAASVEQYVELDLPRLLLAVAQHPTIDQHPPHVSHHLRQPHLRHYRAHKAVAAANVQRWSYRL